MTATPRAVTSLKRRIATILYLRQALVWVAAWCVIWGVGGLVARFAFDVRPALLVWGAAALPLVVIAAVLYARRRKPRDKQLVALIDAHARCGGLLMASTETSLGEWRAEANTAPRVEWRGRRETALALLSAAFAVAVILIPARKSDARTPLAIQRDVERLQDRVEVLREEKVLDEQQAEVMTKTLEELKKEASGEDPAKAWEALDSIDEATAQAAKEAADEAVEQGQQLAKIDAMASALDSGAVDPSQVAEGMKDLDNEVKAAAEENEALANANQGSPTLTKEELKQLAEAAKAGKEKLRNTLNKLRERGLIDENTLRQFEDASNFANRDDLAKFLKKHSGKQKLSTAVAEFQQGKPGVERGRGDAPMFFGEKSDEKGKFDEQTLPPAAAAALAQSQLVAVSAATPEAGEVTRSTGGALGTAKAGAGSAFTAEVLPRHRGTVQRFFERKK